MKYPEINLLGDGMRVKNITDNVEVIIYSEKGNMCIEHVDQSPFEFIIDKLDHTRVSKKLEFLR